MANKDSGAGLGLNTGGSVAGASLPRGGRVLAELPFPCLELRRRSPGQHPTGSHPATVTLTPRSKRLPRPSPHDAPDLRGWLGPPTRLSPRLAIYRMLSTARTHVAVDPSFQAGFLGRHQRDCHHQHAGARRLISRAERGSVLYCKVNRSLILALVPLQTQAVVEELTWGFSD